MVTVDWTQELLPCQWMHIHHELHMKTHCLSWFLWPHTVLWMLATQVVGCAACGQFNGRWDADGRVLKSVVLLH